MCCRTHYKVLTLYQGSGKGGGDERKFQCLVLSCSVGRKLDLLEFGIAEGEASGGVPCSVEGPEVSSEGRQRDRNRCWQEGGRARRWWLTSRTTGRLAGR